ncbi:MAG TPA: hypothetical protein VGD37_12270, partial [Kofleriaceae bacterium]
IHRLAGSGALTAIAFAELPGCWRAAPVHDPFGSSSIAGMALGSGAAGFTLRLIFGRAARAAAWLWSPAACRSPSV